MFCNNCGNEVDSNDKFCRNCGNEINYENRAIQYNVEAIVDEFGNNRIGACKFLAHTYGMSLSKAKELIDNEHKKRASKKSISEQTKQRIAKETLIKQQEKNRIEQLNEDKIPFCPKCKSTSLTAQKKGFGLLKGAIGVATVGAYGITAAGIGKNKIILTCLNCGYQFKPGK